EVVSHHLEELLRTQPGIEDGGVGDLLAGQKIAQAFQHRGFAGAYFARENNEAFAALHAVDEIGEHLFVLSAAKQKRGVRAQVKRVLNKAEEGFVHSRTRLDSKLNIPPSARPGGMAVECCQLLPVARCRGAATTTWCPWWD